MNERGLHIIANFFECENSYLLVDKEKLSKLLLEIVKKYELTPLHNFFHKFGEDEGITGYILLAESHISIHTWPERKNYLTLDIFVCNYNKDNTENAKKMFEELIWEFKPKKVEKQFIERD